MKKFRNTLAIMALVTVAMFSAQTAKAQNIDIAQGIEDALKQKPPLEVVYPDGTSAKLTCDFESLIRLLLKPEYKATVLKLATMNNAKPLEIYEVFEATGLDEGTCWLMSQWYKLQPNIFKTIAVFADFSN